MFNWKPTKETLITFFLGCIVVVLGKVRYITEGSFISDTFGYLQVVIFGFILPFYYVFFIQRQSLSELGLTKKRWLISIVLSVIFSVLFSIISKTNIIANKEIFNNSLAIQGVLVELLICLWEVIFFYGFLHLRFRKAFGPIFGLILSSLFLSGYTWSFHYKGSLISLFIFSLICISIFNITKNILIIFPFLKGTLILNSLIRNPKAFETLASHQDSILFIFLCLAIVSVYFYAKRAERHKFRIKKVLIGLFLFVIIFTHLFAIFKLHHSGQESTSSLRIKEDPILFWRLDRNLGGINSLGFRDKEYEFKKRENIFRIICIGDSATFGYFVNPEETFSKKLEVKLNKQYPFEKFEVINAGTVGYSSYQGKLYLKEIINNFSPDLVIAYFGFNDATPPPPSVSYSDKIMGQKMMSKRMINSITLQILIINYLPLGKLLLYVSFNNKMKKIVRVSPEDYKDNLEEMNAITKREGIKIIFIEPFWRKSWALPRELYQRLLPQNSLQIDLLKVFSEISKDDSKFFISSCHLSPLGHGILADKICKILTEENIIK